MDGLNVPYTICEVLVALGAVIGNSLVIVAFFRERRLRRRTNYYIVSLAVADLLVGLVGIPCALLASVGLPRHLYGCLLTISLLVVLCTISIFCLVAVSVDRYWAILFPMGYARNVTTKIAIWIILVCWVLGGVVGFLPLMGWHAPPSSPQLCLFTKVMDYNYLVFLYFATIVFPALLLAAFYAHIYSVVLNQFKQMLIINGTTENNSMLRVLGAARKREVKATQNLSIIVLFFIICWMPLYTINFIEAYCTTCQVPLPLLNSCIILSHLNSALNPLLYAYHLKDFRLALKYVVCGKQINSLKRLDSNNTSNYDQHNKISTYDNKKYSTRSCVQMHKLQISHHGNRYNSCYYPDRMSQHKYSKMQIESINMQKFNESKVERKLSKEDKERKLSSPYKYQKFNDEEEQGVNTSEEFVDEKDMIVIEGRKRSATFDKNKVNIERCVREESLEDLTDREESSENTKETNESTHATDGEKVVSHNDTCERDRENMVLLSRQNSRRADCTQYAVEEVANGDNRELSMLETINEALTKSENYYSQQTRTHFSINCINSLYCLYCQQTRTHLNDVPNEDDVKLEHRAHGYAFENGNSDANDRADNLHQREVTIEENKTIKQPDDIEWSHSNLHKNTGKDLQSCNEQRCEIQAFENKSFEETEELLEAQQKSHDAECLLENIDPHNKSIKKESIKSVKSNISILLDQHSPDHNNSPYLSSSHDILQENDSKIIHLPETRETKDLKNVNNETSPLTPEELITCSENMLDSSGVSDSSSNDRSNPDEVQNQISPQDSRQCHSPNGCGRQESNHLGATSPLFRDDVESDKLSPNHCSITRTQSHPSDTHSSRNPTKLFSSFKWRSKSKERNKQIQVRSDERDFTFQFKIFDINVVRNEDFSSSTETDAKKI